MNNSDLHDKLLKEFVADSLRELMGLLENNVTVADYMGKIVEREDARISAAIEFVDLTVAGDAEAAEQALRHYLEETRPTKPKRKGLFR